MLRTAVEQGVTEVVNTIHFQHPKVEGLDINHEGTKRLLEQVAEKVEVEGIPVKLHLGAEVFYLPNLMDLKDDPLCTFGHGKYMLVEFQIHQLPPDFENLLFQLKMAGVTPIIAHPERYKPIQRDIALLEKLIRSGCVVQIDAGSVCGTLGHSAKKASLDILRNGFCHIIGSDAHDNRKRNFCLQEAVEIARGIVGDYVDEMVNANPRKVIDGLPIDTDIQMKLETSRPTLFSRLKERVFNFQ